MNKILRTQKWFLEWFLIVSTNEIALWLKYGDGIGMHFVHNAIRGWLWSCEEPNELWQSAWSRADIRVEIILFLLNPWLIMLPGVVAQIKQGVTEVDKGCYIVVSNILRCSTACYITFPALCLQTSLLAILNWHHWHTKKDFCPEIPHNFRTSHFSHLLGHSSSSARWVWLVFIFWKPHAKVELGCFLQRCWTWSTPCLLLVIASLWRTTRMVTSHQCPPYIPHWTSQHPPFFESCI